MRTALKTTIAVLALAGCLLSPAFAEDQIPAAKLALAKELMIACGTADTLSGPGMAELMTRQVKHAAPSIDDDALAALQRIASEEFNAGRTTLLDDMAKMYASRFSESDLQAMVAFYKTDAGKHFAAETPAIASESARIVSGISAKIMARFRTYLEDRVSKDQPTDKDQTKK